MAVNPQETATQESEGLRSFLLVLAVIVAVRVLLGFLRFPDSVVALLDIFTAAFFLGAPIIGIYYAASDRWTFGKALIFLVIGLAVQVGLGSAIPSLKDSPFVNLVEAVSQAALPVWCCGLGALIAVMLRDKNMLLPIAVFLAILDMMLVFTDVGTVNQALKKAPSRFTNVALSLPKVQSASAPETKGHRLAAQSYAGPADLVFLGMFFVAIFKYDMRAKATIRAIIPTLLIYLALVPVFGALPALVPIGSVVLIVNWREFKLKKEELAMTLGIIALAIAVLGYGIVHTIANGKSHGLERQTKG
jgi:hypothetical protein